MEYISVFIYAYMLLLVYEILTEERHCIWKWLLILLLGITKYIVELGNYAKYLVAVLLCTLLILYSICIRSKHSNMTNFKFALISYGINYVISLLLSGICGSIIGLLKIGREIWGYLILNTCRILVIIMLLKGKRILLKIKQGWISFICVIATIILLFVEQLLRVSYTTKHKGYVYIAIAGTCLAAIFTFFWLLDHYKMSKIQKMYADDNRQMSQKLHRSKEILPMIANYASNMDGVQDGEMRKKLEAVCRDYGKELGGAEMSAELFETTGIDFVDLLLRTKIIECEEQDIELDVFVSTQIDKDMKRMNITEGEITRLLGDLLRNAINAVDGLENKMILLLIARDEDDCVLIRVYDSGIPFPPHILEHFGERGNTTWGTGNGLADMMETVSRARASIEINRQMEPQDVFTKGIFICFDGRNRVMISKNDEDQGKME